MKIQDFCDRLGRYAVKFEHHITCILKEDLGLQKTEEEWLEHLVEYIKNNPIDNDEPEMESIK